MTRTDVEVLTSCVVILIAWLYLFGVVIAVEDCVGIEEEPVPLFIRGPQ